MENENQAVLNFTNAVVEDYGWGLKVNGHSLEKLITELLGVRFGEKPFNSNCCDVRVVITPKNTPVHLSLGKETYHSVEAMREARNGNKAENAETEPEE